MLFTTSATCWLFFKVSPIFLARQVQTPEEKWDVGPGQIANSAKALARGAKRGQVHFFPALVNCKHMKEEFIRRGCAKIE